jgi:hypothetical protein
MRKRLLLLGAGLAAALTFAAVASAVGGNGIANGDFSTGSLSPWTTFTTANGTINGGDVQSFDTTGTGASLAAHFNAGEAIFSGANEGGGIYQNFSGAPYTVSADVASQAAAGFPNNGDCGTFVLQLDGSTIASHAFGVCPGAAVARWHFSVHIANGVVGVHQLRILVERTFTATPPNATPNEYVDNVRVDLRLSKV